MKKIAFVAGWYTYDGRSGIHENNEYVLNCLYNTAKKYFLLDCDVDFIFITNDENIKIENVKNIKIDHKVDGFWHMCLMKILSLKYIEDEYDIIFVSDTDQIFVNPVTKDILDSDFYLLNHFYYPTIKSIHDQITDTVPLNFDTTSNFWTMGNFFGGLSHIMKSLSKYTEEQHNLYVSEKYNPDIHFYTRYPEELFLIKYIFENNIPHKRLHTTMDPKSSGENYFLSDFKDDESVYPLLPEVKVLHNTKKNIEVLKKIINYYI